VVGILAGSGGPMAGRRRRWVDDGDVDPAQPVEGGEQLPSGLVVQQPVDRPWSPWRGMGSPQRDEPEVSVALGGLLFVGLTDSQDVTATEVS